MMASPADCGPMSGRTSASWSAFGSYALRKDYPLRGVGEREDYKIISREGA